MMFNKTLMLEIIGEIEKRDSSKWFVTIIINLSSAAIDNGMAEFEMYGTYVMSYYPDRYVMRNIKAYRMGRAVFGELPGMEVLGGKIL